MAIVKKAPADPVVRMEHEQAELRKQSEQEHAQLSAQQSELAGLLASMHGATLARGPLLSAIADAEVEARDAQEGLARNLGRAGEDVHTSKVYEAQEVLAKAKTALVEYDKQNDVAATKARIATLRTAIEQGEESLRKTEEAVRKISSQIDAEVQAASRAALKRIFATMQDLLSIFEADGVSLARLQRYDCIEFEHLIDELVVDREDLYSLISPNVNSSAGYLAPVSYDGPRPYLRERQQAIRERLTKLSG